MDPGWYIDSKVNRYTANVNITYRIMDNLSLNMSQIKYLKSQKGCVGRHALSLVLGNRCLRSQSSVSAHTILFYVADDFVQIVSNFYLFPIITSDHSFRLHVVEHSDERIPISFHVIQYHVLLVITNAVGRSHGEHLVECADAARQSYDHLAFGDNKVFAVAQIITHYAHVHIFGNVTLLFFYRGNHADGLSFGIMHGFCYALHQSHVASAENNGMTVFCYPSAQFFGHFEEIGVYIMVCRTKNSYFHTRSFYLLIYSGR